MSNENSISYIDFKEKMLSYFSSHVKVKTQTEMIQLLNYWKIVKNENYQKLIFSNEIKHASKIFSNIKITINLIYENNGTLEEKMMIIKILLSREVF